MKNPYALEISSDYLEILQREGRKAWEICQRLNENSEFLNTLPSVGGKNTSTNNYKTQHLLLRDLVMVFNEFVEQNNDSEKIPVKAGFILIFLYEKLQGKDLGESYGLSKIHELTISKQFNQNVKLIRNTCFFPCVDDLKSEFILPALLLRTNSTHFPGITSFLTRIASLIVKADEKITTEEEELLKLVSKKINQPKIILNNVSYNEVPEDDSLEIVLKELRELIGLEGIKKSVEDLTNFLKVQKLREEKGLKTSHNSFHAVFMGPPGTGKTTLARLLGRIYKHLGYLKKGHVVETDRAGMVAGYVGQTAIKADEIIKTAIGGVLFIDEAYALSAGNFNDFGGEAIEILIKRMEDHRNDLVVVVAGYPEEMKTFIQSNPGLQSRFNRYFEFDHFDVDSLMKIFKMYAQKADFIVTDEAEDKLLEILERIHEKRHQGFGNARTVRNLFEKIIERQANRIVSVTPITEDILMTLNEEDIPEVLETVKEIIRFEDDE